MSRWRAAALAGALVLAATPWGAGAESIAYLAAADPYWQVWTMDPDGGSARQVTRSPSEKARISWFPDGRTLLVNTLDGRVFRVDVASGEETEIELPLRGTTDAVVSPDGTRIAFSLSTAGSVDDNEIWVVDADGGSPEKLTQMPWLQHDPAWSADGAWIWFVSGDGGQAHDIWRVNAGTRATEQLTAGALYHFELAAAPDGRLAFSSNRSGDYELYVQPPEGPAEAVAGHPGLDGAPSWASDGRALVFHSTRSGEMNVWRVEPDGSGLRQLTRHEGGARNPVWGPGAEP